MPRDKPRNPAATPTISQPTTASEGRDPDIFGPLGRRIQDEERKHPTGGPKKPGRNARAHKRTSARPSTPTGTPVGQIADQPAHPRAEALTNPDPVPSEVIEAGESPAVPAADEERAAEVTESFFRRMDRLSKILREIVRDSADLPILSQRLHDMAQVLAEAVEKGGDLEDALGTLDLWRATTRLATAPTKSTAPGSGAASIADPGSDAPAAPAPLSAAEIIRRGLVYSEQNQKVFTTWWDSLTPDLQKRLAVEAERFSTWEEYLLSPGLLPDVDFLPERQRLIGALVDSRYADFQAALPRISRAEFKKLMVAQHAVIKGKKAAGHLSSLVKQMIDDHTGKLRSAISNFFNSGKKQRPVENESRDRELSGRAYEQDISLGDYKRLADLAEEIAPQLTDPSTVAKAIRKCREARKQLVWALRVWIHETNFPRVHDPCPACGGTGKARNSKWDAWCRAQIDKWKKLPPDQQKTNPILSEKAPENIGPKRPSRCETCGGRSFCLP